MQKVLTKLDQFIRDAKEVRLRRFEKYAIRERLIMQMEKDAPTIRPVKSKNSSGKILTALAVAFALLVASGGIALAFPRVG